MTWPNITIKGTLTRFSSPIYMVAIVACLLLLNGCAEKSSTNVGGLNQTETAVRPSATPHQLPVTTSPEIVHTSVNTATSPDPATGGSHEISSLTTVISHMTLEEKIGQMLLVGIDGTTLDSTASKMISRDKVGGIILYADNIENLKGLVSLTNELKASNAGSPAPLFISVDQEGGKVSRLPKEYAAIPSNGTVGASDRTDAGKTMGKLLAREVLSAGFNMNFAPVLDINSNPDNPVIGNRAFGNTAETVIKLGIAEMKGMAGEGIIPVVKHFPGHGDTSVDSHLDLPVVSKNASQLAKLEWLPFQKAIQEKADAVMVAHILYPKIDPDKPASLSATIIGKQLREELGFKGVVITDDLTMGAITDHYTLSAAAIETVLAGSDILLVAHEYDNEQAVRSALLNGVRNGKITENRINESVLRILSLKEKYRLTDHPVPVPDLTQLNNEIKAWRKTVQ